MKLVPALALTALVFLGRSTVTAQENSAKSAQNESNYSPANPIDDEKYTFTSRSNLVFLPTRVQNKRGEAVYGLKPEQFIVEDNGLRQSVRIEDDPDSIGLSLVVAIQCSRSADKEFNKFKTLSTMIESIVGEAPHEIAVLSYGEGPYLLGNFSSDPDALRSAISKVTACGDYHATTIDTVHYALNLLKRRQNHYRRAILLISEGRDHGSRSSLHDVVSELGVTDTVIYAVTFSPAKNELIRTLRYGDPNGKPPIVCPPGPSTPPPPKVEDSSSRAPEKAPIVIEPPPALTLPPEFTMMANALRHSTAQELALLSGGEYLKFTTQKGFEEALHQVSNKIHDYYLLSFKPPSTPTFGLHSLRVRVPDYPDAVIQTRRSYWSGMLDQSARDVR